MKTIKTHRRYPDNGWEFKAISTTAIDANRKKYNISYYTGKDRGKAFRAVEIASGFNFVPDASRTVRSHSRRYKKLTSVPMKWKKIALQLAKIHRKTKWDTGKGYLNIN